MCRQEQRLRSSGAPEMGIHTGKSPAAPLQHETGLLFIDGKDINTIPLKTLRENIGYVPQDNFLFSDTLKSNIAFGAENEDMEPSSPQHALPASMKILSSSRTVMRQL